MEATVVNACSVADSTLFNNQIQGAYRGAAQAGMNTSLYPNEGRLLGEVEAAWPVVCSLPRFASDVQKGGWQNFSFGLELAPAPSRSNATFTESWANSTNLIEESWVMDAGTGNVTGPYTTTGGLLYSGPSGSAAGPPSSLPSTSSSTLHLPFTVILGVGVSTGLVLAVVSSLYRRR